MEYLLNKNTNHCNIITKNYNSIFKIKIYNTHECVYNYPHLTNKHKFIY
jgi:hypothetical protein